MMAHASAMTSPAYKTAIMPTLYFAYGSNLSLHQMRERCPSSTYVGVGILRGWTWIISARGYANLVAAPSSEVGTCNNLIYGLVYELPPQDESRLDGYEGVPWDYTKEWHPIELWEEKTGASSKPLVTPGTMMQALVYIDRIRVKEDQPKKEYIGRMRRGIFEAAQKGIPMEWMEAVMGQFLPLKD